MKTLLYTCLLTLFGSLSYGQELIITGVIDGPLSGGLPKAVELFVAQDIADLSIYGIGSANNGGGSDGEEFTFPAVTAAAGTYIYVASEAVQFTAFMGFAPDYTSGAANVNGDDAIELFNNGSVIDLYGDINLDGTGQPWEYLDGWAYRIANTGPDGSTFTVGNWSLSGPNALDGEASNASAAIPFPNGTYNGGGGTVILNPGSFTATADGTMSIDLSWTLNGDGDEIVLAFSNAGPVTADLVDGSTYIVGQTLSDGSTVLTTGATSLTDHTGLLENTSYNYKIWSVNSNNEYSSGISADATTDSSTPIVSNLIITTVFDGPLSGGTPKGIELYALDNIADLSAYGVGSANNGGGSDGEEFTFPADGIAKGEFIYVSTAGTGFEDFFGFAPNYTTGAMAINGDDAVELFFNGSVIDVFGDINVDGSGQPWDYLDGWASRVDNTGPDGSTFVLSNWTFSGINVLDNELTNGTASTPVPIGAFGPDLIITGVVDGPLSGGTPKAVEFYARNAIADLSEYGFGSANNGGGSDGEEFTFPAVAAAAGSFIYVASESNNFNDYFGFTPDYTSSAAGINGDDAIELFFQGEVLDVFGDINVDGSGQAWDYLDSWAYRVNGTGPDGATFELSNWTYGGVNTLDNTSTNASAGNPFPIGTYGSDGPVVNPDLIPIATARGTATGELVQITGTLTVADEFGGSAYIQDATGGIAIFDQTVHGDGVFSIGDSITIVGVRSNFNDQIQISPVTELVSHGPAQAPVEALTITLSQLADHRGELVRIANPSFPTPGDLLFENSNYNLTDASGSGEIRIDRDVTALVGPVQPSTCAEAIGVVGQFFEISQLLPRQEADLACAEEYVPPQPPVTVDPASTLDIVTWNIEWFGDEGNSPAAGSPDSDAVQRDSVLTIISQLQPDILAVQEIADDALFAELVGNLPGYDYVLSPAVSRPNDPGVSQKVGMIYNTATVTLTDTKVLLESIHPLYNGGDASALINYPSAVDRFYASGRLPFLVSTEITIDGQMTPYDFVVLHARANGSTDAQLRYDMRKYDVEVLKDTLDAFYANSNLVLLGDYNDDVDVTVADVTTTVSSYEEYANDGINYDVLTDVLSAANLRSFVFRENMIDHIAVTDELAPLYIPNTAQVHYEFYDSDYARTASDHFPVSVRLVPSSLIVNNTNIINPTCNSGNDGIASISVSGGISPYTYLWSNGQTSSSVTGLTAGSYTVEVKDAIGMTVASAVTLVEPLTIAATVSDDALVYFGYTPEACTDLSVSNITGGTGPYQILWSTGETDNSITVCPETTSDYTAMITDINGCESEFIITVEVINVVCGNNSNKVELCHNGKTKCVSANAVPALLNNGAYLGACTGIATARSGTQGSNVISDIKIKTMTISPNPASNYVNISITGLQASNAQLTIYDPLSRVIFNQQISEEQPNIQLDLSNGMFQDGLYFVSLAIDGERITKKLFVTR